MEQQLELFLHGQGAKPRSILAEPTETLRDALVRADIIHECKDPILVFVGECEEALAEPDDLEHGADAHEPADINLTLEALGIKRHHHLHCHTCRHIAVAIVFNDETKQRKFSPSTTIGTITQWVRRRFHLDPAAAAEYVLQICGKTDQPRSDKHLGELVKPGTCTLCFEIVKEVTPQG